MCFSATASLAAGAALGVVGVVTIAKARNKKELPLASLPLLFSAQQLIDGVVWLSLGTPLGSSAVIAYALLAFVFWPIFVPFALLRIEPDRIRREILEAISLVGLGVGLFFLYYMISDAVTAQVVNHCVAYDTPHPYRLVVLAFYLIVTAGPFLVSSKKILNIFGTILMISFAIAGWFYIETFSSTWCFFSAIQSIALYWYFSSRR